MEITKEIFETVLEVFKEQAEKELTYKKLNALLSTGGEIGLHCNIGEEPNKINFTLEIQQSVEECEEDKQAG